MGVVLGDNVFDSGWHEHVHVGSQQVVWVHRRGAGETVQAAVVDVLVSNGLVDVDAVLVPVGARNIGNTLNFYALRVQENGRPGAHVAEALNGRRYFGRLQAQLLQSGQGRNHHAAAGGLGAAQRTAHHQGLARNHGRRGHAVGLRKLVHEPGHLAGAGAHVGGRNVAVGAKHILQGQGIAAGHALNLAGAHRGGVANDAALGPAVGNVNHGALPRHPGRQGLHFVEVHIFVVPDAALARAQNGVVNNPVALEHVNLAVVHRHRNVDDDLLIWCFKDVISSIVEAKDVGRDVEARHHRLERVFAV